MKKLYIFALSLFLMGLPAAASDFAEEPESEMTAISISVQGNHIHVLNAEGETLEVFNLTGVRVASYHIDSNDRQIALNLTRGCYIIKVGKVVRKTTVK